MIDLRTISDQELQALNRVKSPENEMFRRLIASQVEELKQKLVAESDTVRIYRTQGRADALQDLLRAINESAEALNRA